MIPRVRALITSIRQRPQSEIRPTPPAVQQCLNLLFVIVVISLIRTLPYFQPPNIFYQTKSRLGLSNELIFSRLSALRKFTPLDEVIKDKFTNDTDRIRYLYAAYGPYVITECPFCQSVEPTTYFYYALPSILFPHLLHIVALGIVTSSSLSGSDGSRWRTLATIAGVALASAEVGLTWGYNWEANIARRELRDQDFFFWRMQLYRYLGFALVDGLLGWALWLTSTKRWLVQQPSVPERLSNASQLFQSTLQQLAIFGPLHSTILRDQTLRGTSERYWTQEPRIMDEIEREREVVDAKNIALSRLDFGKVQTKAQTWVDSVFAAIRPSPATSTSQHAHSD